MWIRDVDLPEMLIGEHRSGGLVIFVGAGASRAAPSNLPDFRTLTAEIAQESEVAVTEEQLDHPDVLLGDLQDEHDVDVHLRVKTRIGVETSRMNALHEAILALAAAGPPARIVTTNYDPHLTTAAEARNLRMAEYVAPALPMGDDFEGLVYLHGCLRQEPRHLVVTDKDFGRAYLRDAWAARFLERMFATYAVLFIGYSHNDVVMSYLGRSLRTSSARFALTPDPAATNWRRLGIHPIGYRVDGTSHDALKDGVAGWASWASMGLLDHRQRVAQIVSGTPSQVPDEASYMEAVISDGDTVAVITELARGVEWLTWASAQPEFRRLLDPRADRGACSVPLASWFVENYVMDETLTDAALSVINDAGGRIGDALYEALGHSMHRLGAPRPRWLGPWIVLLVRHPRDTANHWLEYALTASRWPEDRDAALLLFDHLAEPVATYGPRFTIRPHLDVRTRGDDYWLRQEWNTKFKPNLGDAARDVIAIVDRHLRHASHLLSVAGESRPGWDPLSFARSAIEPHEQDAVRDSIAILIDAARDCVEALLDDGDPLGPAYLDAWAATDVALLRRLAVHGWAHRSNVDGTAKITWLNATGWLFDLQVRHEVFRLIAVALPDASQDVADALVLQVAAGPPDADESGPAYETYNALAWITQHASGLQSARAALDRVQVAHPDLQPREHPDLLAWFAGFAGPQLPMSTDDLHQRIAADPNEALAALLQHENSQAPFDLPTWNDATDMLAATVNAYPADGFAVLDSAGDEHDEIVRRVIHGWATASVDDDDAELIVARLDAMDLARFGDDVAQLLVGTNTSATEWAKVPGARQLAARAWSALPGGQSDEPDHGWLSLAFNHPAGRLAQFWVRVVAADWRAAGDAWEGMGPRRPMSCSACSWEATHLRRSRR